MYIVMVLLKKCCDLNEVDVSSHLWRKQAEVYHLSPCHGRVVNNAQVGESLKTCWR